MGIIYTGPYAGYLHPPGVKHEGYAARLMPDGTLTTWRGETGHIGLVGACCCGRHSDTVRPGADHGHGSPAYRQAEDDFEAQHLNPLIERAAVEFWPTWSHGMQRQLDLFKEFIVNGQARGAIDTLVEIQRRCGEAIAVADLAQAPPPASPPLPCEAGRTNPAVLGAFGPPTGAHPAAGRPPPGAPPPAAPAPTGRRTTR
jgi:hypothetical protein